MEEDTVFIGWTSQKENWIFPKFIYRFKVVPIKMSARFYAYKENPF